MPSFRGAEGGEGPHGKTILGGGGVSEIVTVWEEGEGQFIFNRLKKVTNFFRVEPRQGGRRSRGQ